MKDFAAIEQAIRNKAYKNARLNDSWGGAGAAISAEPNATWQNDTSIVYYCTPDAQAYIWLLGACSGAVNIDYLTKYGYYPFFIETVAAVDAQDIPLEEKLLQVLAAVRNNREFADID